MTAPPPPPRRRRWNGGRWQLPVLAALAVLIWSGSSNVDSGKGAATEAAGDAAEEDVSGGAHFTCPDGRRGLHVIHARFLVNQTSANRVFVASRLQLMRAFFVASLNAQTSQRFVVSVAHGHGLDAATLQALRDTLGLLHAPTLTKAEHNLVRFRSLTLGAVAAQLAARGGAAAQGVELFVTSRMDVDDAAHVGAVEGVQAHACAGGQGAEEAVRLVYMHEGALWFPSTEAPHGQACRWTNGFVSHLAILQSMVLSGAALLRTCPLNVYSYPHYKPQALEKMRVEGCAFAFNARRNVHRWRPAGGGDALAALYTKTLTGWSYGKLQHKGVQCSPAAPEELAARFGVSAAALSLANLAFAGLEAHAELFANSSAHQLER
jgi:hypothetical protein